MLEQISVEWILYVNVKVLDGKIVSIKFDREPIEEVVKTSIAQKLKKELEAYFDGKVVNFNYPVLLNESNFTKKVLEETRKIPYGKTLTYGELASKLKTKGYRAVGLALSKNPAPIVIPCHRVVSKRGLGGYSSGIEIKRELLKLERYWVPKRI